MKKLCFCAVVLCFFALSSPLAGYDTSPSSVQIIPEVVWAAATGGGTWVTELQITAFSSGTTFIRVEYYYNGNGASGAYRYIGEAYDIFGLYRSVKSSNILALMQADDDGFQYYGTSGTLVIYTQGSYQLIKATARTVNGNFGKTFPGIKADDANSANVGREMMIQDLRRNAAYRTFTGFWLGGGSSYMTVEFTLYNENGSVIGSSFTKIFGNAECMIFNPFVQAGVPSGDYDNVWLRIRPLSSDSNTYGLFSFASSANNYTNDTYAHIATQFQ